MGKSRRQYAKPKESPAGLLGSQAIAAALAALLALLLAGVSILKPLSLLRTPPPCTVDRRGALSAERFMAEYDGARPVVLLGAASNWSAVRQWTRAHLLDRFGELRIDVGQPDLLPAEIAVGVNRTLPLAEFVTTMDRSSRPVMAFDTAEFSERARISEATEPLPHFSHWRQSVPYFTWGPRGLGLPFHSHAANYAATIIGQKLWFILPPDTGTSPLSLSARRACFPDLCFSTRRRLADRRYERLLQQDHRRRRPWAHRRLRAHRYVQLASTRQADAAGIDDAERAHFAVHDQPWR